MKLKARENHYHAGLNYLTRGIRMKKLQKLGFTVLIAGVGVCHADFKYTQSSKMTGGSLIGMTKALGVFSKSARQINEPQLSTIMVKGNRMRSEHANGQVQIIDLDGRRFINIDATKKTYSTMTFEEFKAAMQKAQERAKEEQAKEQAKETKTPEASNVTIVPKFTAEDTGATKTVLDLPTKEVKWRLAMEFQSTDPKVQQQGQSGAMTMNSDAWVASSVPGSDELHQFYTRMSKELDWLPSMMGGMAAGMNMQMGSAATEFQKQMAQMKGMPLLQNVSFGMTATGVSQSQNGQTQAAQPASTSQPSTPPQDSTVPNSPERCDCQESGWNVWRLWKEKETAAGSGIFQSVNCLQLQRLAQMRPDSKLRQPAAH